MRAEPGAHGEEALEVSDQQPATGEEAPGRAPS
jgi:hypothetical protein